uniref:Oxidative stress-induced growth inhibitor 2 n=1 Tax=Talaromyces marneffei PM1 TaxID=1077442 RepID=A0A093VFN3_TALMA
MSPPSVGSDLDIDIDTDSVIVGNGPSSMILSYILHGHIPYYDADTPHPDSLLHAKLKDSPCLLRPDLDSLTCHFGASSLSYSTQALPINVLLDTLLRPQGEVDDLGEVTNVQWHLKPHRAVPHVVVGNAPQPGGLWAMEDPIHISWDIGTLSYAGMLSLPGYTFADHYRKTTGKELAAFTRPSRRELAGYLRVYPAEAGIADSFRDNTMVDGIHRIPGGFYIPSHRIRCKHLVLASGIFSHLIQPPPVLAPLLKFPKSDPSHRYPLLVVGSGFTAADAIISAPPGQPILHTFLWNPNGRPSPLKSCHQQAYPEYAGIYRLMKRAALSSSHAGKKQKARRLASTSFLESRNWDDIYEGVPNCTIEDVQVKENHAIVTLALEDGTKLSRLVCGLVYGVGRLGTLDYLDSSLRADVLKDANVSDNVMEDLEVAPDVFVIGSLTGDSLIRFAYGGCVYAAYSLISASGECSGMCTPKQPAGTPTGGRHALMNGVDGHAVRPESRTKVSFQNDCQELSSSQPQKNSWWNTIRSLLF